MKSKPPPSTAVNRLCAIAVGLAVLAGVATWGVMILHRGYNYDEVQRAHSIWMTSQGLRPYHDFFECHPPYFALLSPLTRTCSEPGDLLLALRLIAAGGNLLFLAGLAAIAVIAGGAGRLPAILGTALVAFHPAVLEFLAEFRIDGWGYALAAWSLVWYLHSRWRWRLLGFGIATGLVALLLSPKLALLPPMIVVLDQLKVRHSWKEMFRSLGAYAIGTLLAGGIFWLWLAVNGIGVNWVFAFLVKYNALSNAQSVWGHGLLRSIARHPVLSAPLLVALVVWVSGCIRAKSFPAAYPAALAAWLCLQALLVSYPLKQYYAPWLLFASGFFPFLYSALNHSIKHAATVVTFGLCACSLAASVSGAATWSKSGEARDHAAVLRTLNQITQPGDFVVAAPPYHPIFRGDTFYLWWNTFDRFYTYDPAGYETERIFEDLPLLRDFASERFYREQLSAHPPALVAISPFDPQRQQTLIKQFLLEHQADYDTTAIGKLPQAAYPLGKLPVAVRSDRMRDWKSK